ncbi:MAG: kynureninase [Bacteroidales bacterium]
MIGPDYDFTHALAMDAANPLSGLRSRFHHQEGIIYMDGNSLGLFPKAAEDSLNRVVNEWKTLGIKGWLEAERPWFYFAEQLGAMAASLVGAKPDEVVMTGTTTVNIHSLISTFFQPQGQRRKILADALNFPSDLYAMQGQLKLHGLDAEKDLILVEPDGQGWLNEQDIVDAMTDQVALVFLPSVLYRSGQLLDIELLTREAHKRDILIGFDCSHSVGAVPHYFDAWEVDFALWCSYKYLNGGPGAPAFLFVNGKHFGMEPKLAGWFGFKKERQFEMLSHFIPESHAGAWQISSPGILGGAPLEGSLKISLEAGIEQIRMQSLKLTSYMIMLFTERLIKRFPEFKIITPLQDNRRGGHIAFSHPEALRINEALKSYGVIPDLRPPDIIRLAPVALYNTFEEVWKVVDLLLRIMEDKEYEQFSGERKAIT